jgi:hypothetical protein
MVLEMELMKLEIKLQPIWNPIAIEQIGNGYFC